MSTVVETKFDSSVEDLLTKTNHNVLYGGNAVLRGIRVAPWQRKVSPFQRKSNNACRPEEGSMARVQNLPSPERIRNSLGLKHQSKDLHDPTRRRDPEEVYMRLPSFE